MNNSFREAIKLNKGAAVVMAGSTSDRQHIDKVVSSLEEYKIPYEVRIFSAHKQPGATEVVVREYNDVGGSLAFVGIAGGVDALSGVLGFHALGLVISSPPDGRNESCLGNPKGSSNAYVEKPVNVGRVIAQAYAGINPRFRELLKDEMGDKICSLETSDEDFLEEYGRTEY